MINISSTLGISLLALSIQSCSLVSKGSRSDFAVPGCERAWEDINSANALSSLEILIINDCSNLYENEWRLPMNDNKGGAILPSVCNPAWEYLKRKGQLENVEFLVKHNCPVFYRHGWIVPPN